MESQGKVLLVEDNFIVALDNECTLREAGYDVVGPVADVESAFRLMERGAISAAVLDVNLGDSDVFPLAERLAHEDIPFIFLTGYEKSEVLPEHFRDRVCLSKPIGEDELLSELEKMLASVRIQD